MNQSTLLTNTQWIPTPRLTFLRVYILCVVGVGTVLIVWLFLRASDLGMPVLAVGIALVWGLSCVMFGLLTLIIQPVAVGLSLEGVIFNYWFKRSKAPWEYVAPSFLDPTKWRFLLLYSQPGMKSLPRSVILSRDQGRAIVNHPSAPRWVMPPEAREKWGYSRE